jgi:hypothetical protein
MVTPITTHGADALDRLAAVLASDPALAAVVTALGGRANGLDAAFQTMLTLRSVSAAVAGQLDQIGRLVGHARLPGESDAIYRRKIRARIKSNWSKGGPDDVIGALDALLDPATTSTIHLSEPFPAALIVAILVTAPLTVAEQEQVLGFVTRAKPAGVGIDGLAYYTDPVFGFTEDADPAVGPLDDGTVQPTAGTFAAYFHP